MDAAGWFSLGSLCLLVGSVAFLALWIRRFRASFTAGLSNFASTALVGVEKQLYAWAFDESQEQIEGKTVTVRKPSQRLTDLAKVIAPVFVGTAVEWAKQNIKLNPMSMIQGGAGGAAGALMQNPEVLKMIPREWRGLAQLAAPFLSRFLPGTPPTTSGEAVKYSNPFLRP